MSKSNITSNNIISTSPEMVLLNNSGIWGVRKETTKLTYHGKIHVSTLMASIEVHPTVNKNESVFVAHFPFLTGKKPLTISSANDLGIFLCNEFGPGFYYSPIIK